VKRVTFYTPFFLFLLGGLCSCKVILTQLYGVKTLEKFDEHQYRKTLNQLASKYDSTLCVSHVATEHEFIEYRSLDEGNKDIGQPIQILYFYDDTLKSFHANCYAKGTLFGKLNWNYHNQFATYYPTSSNVSLIEKNVIKFSDIKSIYKINQLKSDNRACIVFFWCNSFKKQSIIAFDTVVENIRKHVNNKTERPLIILINSDHYFITLEY